MLRIFFSYSQANLNLPVKSKKKRGSVMDFFSPFGDSKPFGGFGSHMSGTFEERKKHKEIPEHCEVKAHSLSFKFQFE